MPVHSKNKGAAGGREFASLLREHGFAARRGQQFSGGAGSPDVVSNVPGVHWEIKRVEALQMWAALDQARRDAAEGTIPVVGHRSSRRPWIVILDAKDFLTILSQLSELKS